METLGNFFFSDWLSLARALVVGLLAYVGLLVVLRLSGKRTLSKMNAFDMIVTVALGSALAGAIVNKDTTLLDGLVVFMVLIGLQYLVVWLTTRSSRFGSLVKSEPALLLFHGRMLRDEMDRERVVEAEVLQAVRAAGFSSLKDVAAVVLETDGSFSVMRERPGWDGSSLANLDLSAARQQAPERQGP